LFSTALQDPLWQLWAGRLALFVAVLFAGSVVAWLVGYFVRRSVITGTDRILGMLFGIARGVVLAGILALALELGGFSAEPWSRESKLLPYAAAVGVKLRDAAQEQLAHRKGIPL
jgi:membrane protein required for colicin V production